METNKDLQSALLIIMTCILMMVFLQLIAVFLLSRLNLAVSNPPTALISCLVLLVVNLLNFHQLKVNGFVATQSLKDLIF